MKYALHVRKHKGVALSRSRVWNIGEFGGTLGRAVDCDCVLEDESRFISRRQARVTVDSEYLIQWIQEGGNPSLINGQPVVAGQAVTLKQGDVILVGEYQLELELDEKGFNAIPVDWNLPARNVQQAGPSPESLADPLIAEGDALQTIDDLLAAAPLSEEALSLAPQKDQWDPLGHAVELPFTAIKPEDLNPLLRQAADRELLPQHAREQSASDRSIHEQPVHQQSLGEQPVHQQPVHEQPVHEQSTVPVGKPMAPVVDTVASAPMKEDAVLRALKEGLGLNVGQELSEQQVRLIGHMMRSALNGLLALMSHRSMTRRELRTEMTTMLPRDNNPLKYCPNAAEAFRRLLSPPEAGYLGPVESIEEGLAELLSHQQGLMEALHQGFAELGQDFCPDSIKEEARQARRWPLGSGPLWQTYEMRYRRRFQNGPDQFESALGKVFRQTLDSMKHRPSRSGEG